MKTDGGNAGEGRAGEGGLPRQLGPYRLEKHLGSGGMGSVFRAVCETTRETVAVKLVRVPHGKGVQSDLLARFRQEAEFLSQARHPNIVQFIDFGTEGHELYLVMELVEGQTLRSHLQRQGVLGVKDFLDVAIQLAEVVECLQSFGLVHRDLKPQNVMLSSDLGFDRVKVLDFGLSTFSSELREEAPSDALMMGTVQYAAPEQTGFIERPIDVRTDLYALGCVFFEMLTGSPPFMADSPEQVTFLHLSAVPKSVCDLRPGIPRALGEIVGKLLEKDPDDRYQTGHGLAFDLRECRRNLGVSDREAMVLGARDRFQGLGFGSKTIGREKHFSALSKSVSLAKAGTPHAVVVSGELGLGKSWLLSEFRVRCISERVAFVAARLQKMAFDCGLQPICTMLDSYFMQLLRSSEARRKKVLRILAPTIVEHVVPFLQVIPATKEIVAQVLEQSPEFLESVSFKIETRRGAQSDLSSDAFLAHGLRMLLCDMARVEECLVVELDNVQWADSSVFRFIDELLTASAGMECRLVVLLSLGHEHPSGVEACQRLVHELRLRSVYVHQIGLEPFGIDEVRAFLEGLLSDSAEVCDRLARKLHAFTRGNPLFLREVLKSMASSDHLVFDPASRTWSCRNDDVSQLGLPSDAVDLILERIKGFQPQSRLVLAAAARLGLQFTREAVVELFPEGAALVHETLYLAAREHLLSEKDGRFGFSHSKIREHYLTSICDDEAADVHFRILNRIRDRRADDHVASLREFAHHAYFARKRIEPELVCAACVELALAEESLGDIQRGHEQLLRAFEIASSSDVRSLQDLVPLLRIRLAETLRRLGQTTRARRMLEETLVLIGGLVSPSRLELCFLATVSYLQLLVLQGEKPSLTDEQESLVEIALSLARSEIERMEERQADDTRPLGVTRTLFSLDWLARHNELFATQVVDGNEPPLDRSFTIEERLRRRLASPQGLSEPFLTREGRVSSVVQFLFLASLGKAREEVLPLLEMLWEMRRETFREVPPDFLWAAWVHEFSHEPAPSLVQELASAVLAELSNEDGAAADVARSYMLCMELLTEWRRLPTPELHRHLLVLKGLLPELRSRGCYYPAIWALLLHASFKFLFGEWSEVAKSLEDAVAEAEHLDCRGLLEECHAHAAAMMALRDEGRLERSLERLGNTKEPRRALLRNVALGFSSLCGNPLAAKLDAASVGVVASQWCAAHPLLSLFEFASLGTRLSAALENRSVSPLSLAVPLSQLRKETLASFVECPEMSFVSMFRATLLHALGVAVGAGEETCRSFHAAEHGATAAGSSTWSVFSRLLFFRLKQAEAVRLGSQILMDEASVHLTAATRQCELAGFLRLGSAIESSCADVTHGQELSSASLSRSRDLSSVLGRLKVDRVFFFGASLLGKSSVEELAPAALEGFVELTGAQRGALFVRDRISNLLLMKAQFGLNLDESTVANVSLDSAGEQDPELPLSWSVLLKVRREGRQVVVHDAQTDDAMANQFSVVRNRIRSVFGIPLMHDDELVGIVYLDSCLLNDLFTRDTVKLVQPLVKQVAFSIANIWLQKASEESLLALKQSQKTLVQSEKMASLGQLAASVAHDLRTPLAIVLGLAEDVRELVLDGEREAVVDSAARIVNAAKKMQRLVQSMQDFSRKSSRERQPVSLRKIVDEVLFLTGKRISSAGVELSIQIPSDLPWVHGNANELEQALMNLVNNAVDAMETAQKRELLLQASTTATGVVELRVCDTGVGIAEEHRRQLFQPFFTTKPEGKGTGLGLSIVNTLIQEQGGSVSFDSVAGQGTTFVLTLPSVDAAGNVRELPTASLDGMVSHEKVSRKI